MGGPVEQVERSGLDRPDPLELVPGVHHAVQAPRHPGVVGPDGEIGIEQPVVQVADDRVRRLERQQDTPAADEWLIIPAESIRERSDEPIGQRLLAARPLQDRLGVECELHGAMVLLVCRLSSSVFATSVQMPTKRQSCLEFGRQVRRLRHALGLSQEGLADRANIHRTYIGGIERGERNPTLTMIVRLAESLGVPPARLLEAAEPAIGGEDA